MPDYIDAIQTPIILTSLRTRVDKSIGVSASLPELTPEEVVKFIPLLNTNLIAFFKPADATPREVYTVPSRETQGKTQSQKIRHLLYLCFHQGIDTLENENEEEYYLRQTNKIIDRLSARLQEARE